MRRRDRCGNAAAREDEFFRQGARKPERNERRERKRKGERDEGERGRYASDREPWREKLREREEDGKREREGGEGGGGETETRTASADRRSVPIATRRDRARSRPRSARALFYVHVPVLTFIHGKFISGQSSGPRASSSAVFHSATAREYLKEEYLRSPTGKR